MEELAGNNSISEITEQSICPLLDMWVGYLHEKKKQQINLQQIEILLWNSKHMFHNLHYSFPLFSFAVKPEQIQVMLVFYDNEII